MRTCVCVCVYVYVYIYTYDGLLQWKIHNGPFHVFDMYAHMFAWMRSVHVGELPEDAIWSECDFFVLYFYLFIYNYICMGQVYIMMKDVGELTS